MTNPVLTELEFRLPNFAAATAADYRHAIETGMAREREGLATLAADQRPATVESVLGAWEDAGTPLLRALSAFFAVHACDARDDLEALYQEMAPRLAQHLDAIFLDRGLFERLVALEARIDADETPADEEDRYALAELLRRFRRSGIALDEAQQRRLQELNTRLAELGSRFASLNRSARNAGAVPVEEHELDGLTPDEVAALRNETGLSIALVNTTRQPLAAKLTDAGLRARLHQASVTRALSGEFDTRGVIVELARCRAERAALLGYPHHAALIVEEGCAKSVSAVEAMLVPLAQAALAKAREEATELRARYAELCPGVEFTTADWAFVESIVRRERYGFDEEELAGLLQVETVLDAVYASAHELYGLTFHRRTDLVGHTPDAEVFEVHEEDGTVLGLFIMDFWARPTKNGGAWMNNIVEQSLRDETLPVVTNNCNYTPGTTTITWDGVITMFHEFGHALHGLLAHSKYASRSGTNTPRDFVEFPSQVNEHWAWTPGRVLPADWIDRLKAADTFGQGYATAEAQISAVLDLMWHTTPLDELPASADEVEAFERAALERHGLADPFVPPRYRSQYFAHIWDGGYAASYYGYTWAEVMDADAVAWFEEQDSPVREAGERFRRTLLAPGGSVDPMQTYARFRGRDPELQPLLDRLGLALTRTVDEAQR